MRERRHSWWLIALLAMAASCARAQAAMVVDGVLSEPEWHDAQHFSAFVTTVPNTLAAPALSTEVLVTSDASGIYVAFICDQPAGVPRVRAKNTRDQDVEADRVSLMIDFEGRGNSAYEFSVSISGGIRDAIIGNTLLYDSNGNQTRFNTDWDADWSAAVSETQDQWFVEYHLPWSVAPMDAGADGKLALGVFFSRVASSFGHRYSEPGNPLDRPTFLADMQKVTVDRYDVTQLDVYPYVSGTRDFLDHDDKARAGADVFWKPAPRQQLTATFNPDFGQVESDALVVNFSAIPTFFPDKRPFFTENQSLFDTDNQLVYTRRIGAAPDVGSAGSSDILGAAKYTGGSGNWDYGVLSAFEDDTGDARGRDFFVGRARTRLGDRLTLGWLGTHVERPSLDRTADVQSLDVAWTLLPGATLHGQGMVSKIERPGDVPNTPMDPDGVGHGITADLEYAPGTTWAHSLVAEHYDDRFELDDAGFQERNNLNRLTTNSTYTFRTSPGLDQVRETSVSAGLVGAYNDDGQRLPGSFELYLKSQAPDASVTTLDYQLADVGGVDDLVTRGNGPVHFPEQSFLSASYSNPQTGLFRYTALGRISQGLFHDVGWAATLSTGLHFTEHFIVRTKASFSASPDFVIWQHDDVLASFRYRQLIASSGVDWFPTVQQEFRVLFQWSAGTGHVLQAYRPDAGGTLRKTGDAVSSFSFGDVALQMRYRYKLGALSDLFLVYSHGGDIFRDDDGPGLGPLFGQALREKTASQVLVKLRYRFSIF